MYSNNKKLRLKLISLPFITLCVSVRVCSFSSLSCTSTSIFAVAGSVSSHHNEAETVAVNRERIEICVRLFTRPRLNYYIAHSCFCPTAAANVQKHTHSFQSFLSKMKTLHGIYTSDARCVLFSHPHRRVYCTLILFICNMEAYR